MVGATVGIQKQVVGKLSDWWFAYPYLKYKYDVFLKPYEVNQKVDTRIPVYKHILIGGLTAGVNVGNTLDNPVYAVVIFDLPLKGGQYVLLKINMDETTEQVAIRNVLNGASTGCANCSTKKKLTFEISHIGQKHTPDEFKVEWNGCPWTHKKIEFIMHKMFYEATGPNNWK
jgi:hypothetical protein